MLNILAISNVIYPHFESYLLWIEIMGEPIFGFLLNY